MQKLEIGSSTVSLGSPIKLINYPTNAYTDAQIDDCIVSRKNLPWEQGTRMQIRARFSHEADELVGTAGFGFWNRPFADPTIKYPTLPRAAWFFFGSPPHNCLPFTTEGVSGWYAATLDGTSWQSISMIPFAPFVLLGNQFPKIRKKIWPKVMERSRVSHKPVSASMTEFQTYELEWRHDGCEFRVDNKTILSTPNSPQKNMTFVCWIDNQFMQVKATGKMKAGVLPLAQTQWLEIAHLSVEKII